MRYAIFSDIHANLQAWEAIREDMVKLEADVLVCLGDVVGYGPLPEEVLTSIREVTRNFVLGNHDAAAVGIMNPKLFNKDAEAIIRWTRSRLSADSKKFLTETPLTIEGDDILFVHAEISHPGRFGYIEDAEQARENFQANEHFLTFIGHTHHPTIFDLDSSGGVRALADTDCILDEAHRYIVNVGSVGEPRNPNDIRARYVIYDSDTRSIWFRRIQFDQEAYRRDLAATSLKITPYFLQIIDQKAAALREEEQHAMMFDMQVPETAHGYVSQSNASGITRQLVLPQSAATGTKAKPTPQEQQKKAASAVAMFAVLTLLIVIAVVALLPLNKGRAPVLAVRPSPAPVPPTEVQAPEAKALETRRAAALASDQRSTPSLPGEVESMAITAKGEPPIPAPDPTAPAPEPPAPTPPPAVKPPPEPDPDVLAYWRMDEVPEGEPLPDAAGNHALRLVTTTKPIRRLAPDPIPKTDAANPSALALGAWEEAEASGAFDLSPERSLTFEGWLMTMREKKPIFVAGTQPEAGGLGWRLDVVAAKNRRSRGSIRFVHDAGAQPTTLQSDDINLYDPHPHHFAIVWDHDKVSADTGTLRIFYDSEEVATAEVPHGRLAKIGAYPFRLGAKSNPERVGIDEIRWSDGALKPEQFLNLGAAPVIPEALAFMFDVGDVTRLYKGADSPAHVEGAIPKNQRHWIAVNDAKAKKGQPQLLKTAAGSVYLMPLRIELGRGSQSKGDVKVVIWSRETTLSPKATGEGLFGSDLMDEAHAASGKRAMGLRVGGLEAGSYTLFFTPLAAAGVDSDFEFALGVDAAEDPAVITQIGDEGMRTRRYAAGTAKIGDQKWEAGKNYFKQAVKVAGPADYIVAIVGIGDVRTAIPYLQIVKTDGPSAFARPHSLPIEFRFDGGKLANQASGNNPKITEVSEIKPQGFVKGSFVMAPGVSGGKMLSAKVSTPTPKAKNDFSFTFKVGGTGSSLSGFSFDVSGEAGVFHEVAVYDYFGALVEKIAPRSKSPAKLQWQRFGTMAGDKPLGIRLSPDSYEIRISGFNTKEPKRLKVDNIRVAFD